MCLDYKNITVEFKTFPAFNRLSVQTRGITYTINIKSQQHLKAWLSDFVGYISFTSKKRCKEISK